MWERVFFGTAHGWLQLLPSSLHFQLLARCDELNGILNGWILSAWLVPRASHVYYMLHAPELETKRTR